MLPEIIEIKYMIILQATKLYFFFKNGFCSLNRVMPN